MESMVINSSNHNKGKIDNNSNVNNTMAVNIIRSIIIRLNNKFIIDEICFINFKDIACITENIIL